MNMKTQRTKVKQTQSTVTSTLYHHMLSTELLITVKQAIGLRTFARFDSYRGGKVRPARNMLNPPNSGY